MFCIKYFIICVTLLSIYVNCVRYDGHKLYKVVPKNDDAVKTLEDIRDGGMGLFWVENFNVDSDVRIMVAPDEERAFRDTLSKNGLDAALIFNDVQKIIDEENPVGRSSNSRSQNTFYSLSWDVYHTLDEINAWIMELVEAYPGIVTPEVMGLSVEGREIRGMIIDFKPDTEDRPVGIIEGTLHAREWISPATVTWIVKEFLTSTDPDVRALAEDLEWHVFPVVNPDGYVYTFNHNRMWRKNRSTASYKPCPGNIADDISNGVDLNRNFDFVWGTVGASNDSCLQTYAGPSPASEPETQAISNYVRAVGLRSEIIYYLSFHSYTQLVVIPYSHVSSQDVLAAENYADMYEIAIRGADKLSQRYGTRYRVGISADVLYVMSGTSFDWVKNNTNTKISYLIELRDLGDYGFLLPAAQIIPNCEEVMDGLLEMDKTARRMGYYRDSSPGLACSVYLVGFGLLYILLSN